MNPQIITNSIGTQLAFIPEGEFMMGTPKSRKGGRDNVEHRVRITKSFYLGIYEITQEEFEYVMRKNSSGFRKFVGHDTKRFPVEMVTWNDAVEFCDKLSARGAASWATLSPTDRGGMGIRLSCRQHHHILLRRFAVLHASKLRWVLAVRRGTPGTKFTKAHNCRLVST